MPFPMSVPPAGTNGTGTIIPVRGLAEKGILRDPSAYQLDINAWSNGWNVRIHANKVQRAPIFRSVYAPLPQEPAFVVGYEPSTGYDIVFIAGMDGSIYQYTSGVLTNISPTTGYTLGTDPRSFTATFLGDVLYINRPNQAPIYYGPQSATFATLPNMETTWTCRSLRAFGDYLVALNVTKPATYAQLPHFGGFDSRKAAEFCGPSRWQSNCGAKNCCPSKGFSVLTGSAAACCHLGLRRAFRSLGRRKSRLCPDFRSLASSDTPYQPRRVWCLKN